jgi:hypothetical protein
MLGAVSYSIFGATERLFLRCCYFGLATSLSLPGDPKMVTAGSS